jgi:prophage regulatory protein
MNQLIRLPKVLDRVGLSRSEVYRLMSLDQFPKAVPLGERAVAWDAHEIDAWIAARIAARDIERMAAA